MSIANAYRSALIAKQFYELHEGIATLLETKLLKNEKHQTQVLLELVSDAYLTANRTRYMWSSTQETTPLDHVSPTTTRSQAAGNDSQIGNDNKQLELKMTTTRVWCFSFLSSLVSSIIQNTSCYL